MIQRISLLLVSILSLVVVGCGSSSEDYVFTGNGNNPNTTPGTLTFQFERAVLQAVGVPAGTTAIRFEFLDAASSVLATQVEPFAATITVTPPAGTASVSLTAIDSAGFPLSEINVPVTFPAAGTNVNVPVTAVPTPISFVSLTATPDPVSLTLGTQNGASQQLTLSAAFDNGETVVLSAAAAANATFTAGSAIVTVSDSGVINGVSQGSTSVNVSYTDTQGVTRSDSVTVNVTGGVNPPVGGGSLTLTPDPLNVAPGGTSAPVTATFTPTGGTGINVPAGQINYTISGTGFTVSSNGTVSASQNVTAGATATLTGTYTNATNNVTATDSISVIAAVPTITGRVFSSPSGATLVLPLGVDYQTFVSEQLSDGSLRPVGDPANQGYSYSVTSGTATVSSTGVINSVGGAGDSTVNLLFNGTVVDSFNVSYNNSGIQSISMSPTNFRLAPGQKISYTVTATLADGSTVDITDSPSAVPVGGESDDNLDPLFYYGEVVGGFEFGFQFFTVTVNGVSSQPFLVSQAKGWVNSLDVTVGGLASGRVPFPLSGQIGVIANTDQGPRELLPDEYEVEPTGGTPDTFAFDDGQLLVPGEAGAVGAIQEFRVTLPNSCGYAFNSEVAEQFTDFTASYVGGAGGTLNATFKNYKDDNILILGYSRPVDVRFSNGVVDNFRVAGADLTVAPSNYGTTFTCTDKFGYPVYVAGYGYNSKAVQAQEVSGDAESILTLEARRANDVPVNDNQTGGPIVATGSQTVRFFYPELGAIGAFGFANFIPGAVIVGPGESTTVELQVKGSPTLAGAAQTFVRTMDFDYEYYQQEWNTQINALSVPSQRNSVAEIENGVLKITGVKPGLASSLEARDAAVECNGGNEFGFGARGVLNITVTNPYGPIFTNPE